MDVRKKLVELLLQEDGLCKLDECKDCNANGSCYYYRAADRIIANGVTVLPCNVGDKIYFIDRYTGKIDEDTVKFLTITKNGAKPILTYHNIKFWDCYELGKTAFLTKDEAEAALPQPPKEVE